MRKTTIFFTGLLLAACATTTAKGPTATVETIDFTLPKPSGEQVSLAAYKGKVVLVDMWATWCAPCKESFPFYDELQKKYAGQGFDILAISVDEEDQAVTDYLAHAPVSFTVLRDPKGSLPSRLDLQTMPTAVLVGRDGKVAFIHAGFVPDDKAEIEAKVQAALAAQ